MSPRYIYTITLHVPDNNSNSFGGGVLYALCSAIRPCAGVEYVCEMLMQLLLHSISGTFQGRMQFFLFVATVIYKITNSNWHNDAAPHLHCMTQ